MQQSLNPLPAGWSESVDPASGNIFYHCAATGEATWTRPVAEAVAAVQPQATQISPLAAGWTEHSDPSSGNVFYCYAATGETTWTRPVAEAQPAQPTPAVTASALPAGWTEHADPASGNVFYCYAATGETTWTRPVAQTAANPQPQQVAQEAANAQQSGAAASPLPAGWTEHADPSSGQTFYCYAATGETTWTRPAAQTPSVTIAADQLPDGWTEHSDPGTGKSFYYRAATGETSWIRPAPPVPMPQTHEFELDVLRELSNARSNPEIIAEALRNRLPHFNGKDYFPPDRGGKTAVTTKEGQNCVRDAITYLEKANKLVPLAADCPTGLRLASEDHMLDLGKRGTVGHQGADGSTSRERMRRYGVWTEKAAECIWFGRLGTPARQIVEDLIINDGVPERSDRRSIFDKVFRVAGVRYGPHKTYGGICVINLTVGFQDNEDKILARVSDGSNDRKFGKEKSSATASKATGSQCPGCKQIIISGAVLEGLGKKWHRDCFVCQSESCRKSLRGTRYQDVGGMPYCKECYYSRVGVTCYSCKGTINGVVLKALSQTWHKECFVCGECHKSLGPLDAREMTLDSKPLCIDCANLLPSRRSASTGASGSNRSGLSSPLGGMKGTMGMSLRDTFGTHGFDDMRRNTSQGTGRPRSVGTMGSSIKMGGPEPRGSRGLSNYSDIGKW